MKISVVIPVYNGEKYLKRCLDSICTNISQIEIILSDGLSTDNTLKIAREYSFPENIDLRVYSEKDKGAADAINKGFENASGDILAWIGCDDEFTDGALDYVANIFEQDSQLEWVIGACQRLNEFENLAIISPSNTSIDDIHIVNGIDQPSSFWRKEVFSKVGKLDESYRFGFDWDYWCRFKLKKIKFRTTSAILSKYWFSDTNLTSIGAEDQLHEQIRIVATYRSKELAQHFLERFNKYDVLGFYGREKNLKERIQHNAFLFRAWLRHGNDARRYSLYWLSKQMQSNRDKKHEKHLTVVTAANSEYFTSLLSLIGTLKCPKKISDLKLTLDIWDLGLEQKQLALLSTLDISLQIKSLSDFYVEPFRDAFNPKDDCFAWKSFCVQNSLEGSRSSLLWIDAGAAVSGNLDEVANIISRDGYFLLESNEIRVKDYMTPSASKTMNVSDSEMSNFEIVTTVLGLGNTDESKKFVCEWVKFSSEPKSILGPVSQYRHDQSIASIIARRLGMKPHNVSDFARENWYELDKAFRDGATFMFHRRKWQFIDLNGIIDAWNLGQKS